MRRSSRAALTLVEMLVAMAVTLIMMGAVVTMFGNVGNSITASRAMMEVSERLRNCRDVLQRDLGNVTVTMIPSRRPEMDEGYFEYSEGPQSDANPILPDAAPAGPPAWVRLLGDSDDFIRMTVRSRGEPYVGIYNGNSWSSHTAEIVWFVSESPVSPVLDVSAAHLSGPLNGEPRRLKTLHRRVFLVDPSITAPPAATDDISVSNYSGTLRANTLGDLTKRENRFAHSPNFPFAVDSTVLVPLTGNRAGEDVILTNVLAFDIKAYDPNVPIRLASGGVATLPSDIGYESSGSTAAGVGGYVDLNFASYMTTGSSVTDAEAANSYFVHNGSPLYRSQAAANQLPLATYDTWSMHYEQNVVDENADGYFDPGTNGLDDNGNGVVDDANEVDAPPPYPVPLRGIQVKIRVYEPDSRQVREVTVVQDFLPQ